MTNYYRDNHITHFAYNLTTQEIIGNAKGNALKRSVRLHQHFTRKYGEPKGVWVFAHGTDACEKLRDKLQQMGAIKGW